MANLFLKPSDPILTKKAEEIPQDQIASKDIQQIIKTMLKLAYGQQKDKGKPIMVGLAAPQIGILERIILVDVKANGKGRIGDLRVYINPEITWLSKKETEWYEGCYSTGRICGIVSRPTSIKIQAFTLTPRRCKAKLVEEKYQGYTARIFQHEIDHLDGKVFVDRVTDPGKLHWVLKKEFAAYRSQQAWRNWPRKCSKEKWEKIKHEVCYNVLSVISDQER